MMAMLKSQTESMESSVSEKGVASKGPSFVRLVDHIEEGDTVIVYVSFGSMYPIVVKRGLSITMKFGQLRHEFLIGKQWGSRVTTTAGYIYALRPTSDLWTRCLPKRTQILYSPDVAAILSLLDVRGGSVVAESGTGSGSLSHAIAVGVLPDGHVYTHDIDESRTRKIEQEFEEHGLSHVTTAVVQNVCVEGFFVENSCDGVFLDVPSPWEAVHAAARALSNPRGGRLVSFSPCIEQVQRTAEVMREVGFVQIETIEIVPRQLTVVEERLQSLTEFNVNGDGEECAPGKGRKRKIPSGGKDDDGKKDIGPTTIITPSSQPTHTGYLISATMLPRL
ncbi:hypothetical protein PFISCL1PPCAC_19679 [Pristionchus fissidentatus]|uniref:tRNA (adenine(58)-N(1))-methyltransferase catalytic subunit TRMT61A n=1 Tax=Pristionchus fissidentatus TaxID=1538716 RepID=A0AAV5WBL1_9BILA|nr:hypothetical protein PFISCL1PPCAC_19679 [Pristionchus fissidentatus]